MRKTLLALAIVCVASTAGAQGSSLARLDSLRLKADAAMSRLTAYDDSVRTTNARLDSVRVGPVRMSVETSLVGLASAAAQQMLDSLRPRMGATLERLGRYSYVVKAQRWDEYDTKKPDSAVVIDVYDRAGPPIMNLRQQFDTALVSTSLRMYAPYLVYRDASPAFTAWTSNQVALDSLTVEEWRSLRLSLVSSPAAVGRRCFEGDVEACALGLQITPALDPVREWYDERDRLRIVKNSAGFANSVDAAAAQRCIRNEDFSCISLLRRYPPERLPLPIPTGARSAIVRFALAIGGDGAVERLLAEAPSPMDRVSAAAKLPADTVLARWQDRVRNQRASSRDLTPEIAAASLFWAVALGALSLRSSRWR